MKNKFLCIIQARMNSSRLPGKVLKKVNGITLLEYMIQRVRLAKNIDKIVVATTKNKEDDRIESVCKKIRVNCFRGSENNVLDRYYQCSIQYPEFNAIMRLTGDCPLIDPGIIGQFIKFFNENDYDYISPSADFGQETFPEGIAEIEIFKRSALEQSAEKATMEYEREHITMHMRNDELFKKGVVSFEHRELAKYRLTVDKPEDFKVVKFLIENSKIDDGYMVFIELLKEHPEIAKKNIHIKRNECMLNE